ncbi:MAG: HEAT repeat domain-containing protein [Nibricoccus sp.]
MKTSRFATFRICSLAVLAAGLLPPAAFTQQTSSAAPSGVASAGASSAAQNPTATAPAAPKPGEDRDALLARLTKMLNYGSELGSGRKPTKAEAAIALGLLGDERAIPVLADHLANEENNQLRVQITRALGWIGGPKAAPPLETALKDNYPYVRKQAAEALKTITGNDYDYDKTGLRDSGVAPGENDVERLEMIAKEVAKRREQRQAALHGDLRPPRLEMTEPFTFKLRDFPVSGLVPFYAGVSGKEVLVSDKASRKLVSCSVDHATREQALAAMQKSLDDAGIKVMEAAKGLVIFAPTEDSDKKAEPTKP